MRRRVTRPFAVAGFAMAVAIAVAVAFAACSSGGKPKAAVEGLATKKIAGGAVEVTITPRRLDVSGARFDITMDTHSGALDVDMARSATLEVDRRKWAPARWSGDGPGGHHRRGTLEFASTGPPNGAVRLAIAGLGERVVAEWRR